MEEVFDIGERIDRLLREPEVDISSYLKAIEIDSPVDGTKSLVYIHILSFDGNDRPRTKDLAKYLGNIIIDYAIPRSHIIAAQERDLKNNTTRNVSMLKKKAQLLFNTQKKTGEGGEMLLYLLAQYVLKMPQVLCKMSLKTAGGVHYQGIDGLHIKFDKEINRLALYWGESKMYEDLDNALSECLDSIKPYLVDDSKEANNRDLQLFQDNLDLNDSELEEQILNYLDPDHPNYNKLQFRGICLVGFDESRYPSEPNQKTIEQLETEVKASVEEWKKKLRTRLFKRSPLETFVMHVFMIPLPSVEKFRDDFLEEVRHA